MFIPKNPDKEFIILPKGMDKKQIVLSLWYPEWQRAGVKAERAHR
jgi:hypothetical protein